MHPTSGKKNQLPTHPLHHLTINTSRPRKMKDTIFNNDGYHSTTSIMTNTSTITNETIKHNIKTNHTKSVEDYINSQVDNELIAAKPPVINPEDESLPRGTNRTLALISPWIYFIKV